MEGVIAHRAFIVVFAQCGYVVYAQWSSLHGTRLAAHYSLEPSSLSRLREGEESIKGTRNSRFHDELLLWLTCA